MIDKFRRKPMAYTEVEPRTWVAEELEFIHPARIKQSWQVKAQQARKRG